VYIDTIKIKFVNKIIKLGCFVKFGNIRNTVNIFHLRLTLTALADIMSIYFILTIGTNDVFSFSRKWIP